MKSKATVIKYHYCKYCGAKLKNDFIGKYCPTTNCQWQHGLPEKDDIQTKEIKE